MVQGEHGHVFVFGQCQHQTAQHQVAAEIERPARLLAGPRLQGGLALGRRQAGQIDAGQLERTGILHALPGLAVALVVGRAQDLVTPYDLTQRLGQRPHRQRAAQAQRQRDVVLPGAGLELVDQPQLALCRR